MTTATVTLTLGSVDKPAGKTPGNYYVLCRKSGADPVQYVGSAPSCVLELLPGTWIVEAVRLATDETEIGAKISKTVDVPASVPGAEQVDVPVAIAVAFG